jgi:hypothetical protein
MVKKILLYQIVKNNLKCQLSNISTSWNDKLQSIEKQPMSMTLIHNTPIDNWGQNLYHNFAYNPNLRRWYMRLYRHRFVGYNIAQWHFEKISASWNNKIQLANLWLKPQEQKTR